MFYISVIESLQLFLDKPYQEGYGHSWIWLRRTALAHPLLLCDFIDVFVPQFEAISPCKSKILGGNLGNVISWQCKNWIQLLLYTLLISQPEILQIGWENFLLLCYLKKGEFGVFLPISIFHFIHQFFSYVSLLWTTLPVFERYCWVRFCLPQLFMCSGLLLPDSGG